MTEKIPSSGKLGVRPKISTMRPYSSSVNPCSRASSRSTAGSIRLLIEPLPPAIIDPRKPIEIESFRIAFQGRNPKVVADVTNQLTREFLSANLRSRTRLAEGTREFIEGELFAPFRSARGSGLGLGMFACREIIELHQGSVQVDSLSGRGTTVRVSLPIELEGGTAA